MFFFRILLVTAVAVTLSVISVNADDYQDPVLTKLVNDLMNSPDLAVKQNLALKIARIKSEESKKALNDLLWSINQDDIKSAIDGIVLLRGQDDLFNSMLSQISSHEELTEYLITRHLLADTAYYFPYFKNNYYKAFFSSSKTMALSVMIRLNKEGTRTFLEQELMNKNSPSRQEIAGILIENYQNNYPFARSLPKDSFYDFFRLSVYLKEGSQSDLPVFMQTLESAGNVQTKILCYQGVKQWGSREDKMKIFKSALKSQDDTLIMSGVTLFSDLMDDQIAFLLSRVVKNASYQSTRLAACDVLLAAGKKDYIPYIIPVLRETYQVPEKKYQFADVFVSIISLGFSEIQNRINQNYDIRSFNAKLVSINASLNKIAQTKHAQSFDIWQDWCILQGYTIDGVNIFSRLYSSNPRTRESALNVGLKMLGYKTRFDFFKVYPALSGNEQELLLEITKQLLNKGVLKDETSD